LALRNHLALFDFDNTLSICDSFLPFVLYISGPVKFFSGILNLARRRLSGPVGRREAKQILAQATLKGLSIESVQAAGKEFADFFLPLAMNQLQLNRFKQHQAAGERVVIVSASPRLYLEVIAKELQAEIIATELVEVKGVISGEIFGENCRGPEKVRRISEVLDLKDYETISAYGDSDGDTEMLRIATNRIYRGGRSNLYPIRKIFCTLALYFKCLLH